MSPGKEEEAFGEYAQCLDPATNGVVAVVVLWNGGSPAATRPVIQAKYWDSTDALVVAGMIAKYKAWANSCGIRVGSTDGEVVPKSLGSSDLSLM